MSPLQAWVLGWLMGCAWVYLCWGVSTGWEF